MKVKTARRFVARNRWKAYDKTINGVGSPSFWRRWEKCMRIVKAGEDVLKRKY